MNNTVSKALRLFKSRYGTNLQIQLAHPALNDPRSHSNWESSFIYSRTLKQVSFPIFNNDNQLRAIAVASPVDNSDAILFDEMSDFIQLTLSEHFTLSEKMEILEQTEIAVNMAEDRLDNVIKMPNQKKSQAITVHQRRGNQVKYDFQPIWIHSENTDMAKSIVFAAHDWVSNWAFLNAKELPDLIWDDASGWVNFPQITIFIPEFNGLNSERLELLKTNIRKIRQETGPKPLIVVSSDISPESIDPQLLSLFKVYEPCENMAPKAQAHFLLYNYQGDSPWSYRCPKTDQLYFFPFTQTTQFDQ